MLVLNHRTNRKNDVLISLVEQIDLNHSRVACFSSAGRTLHDVLYTAPGRLSEMAVGNLADDPAKIIFQSFFSAGGHREQVLNGQGCPLFDFVSPAFPLPITALPTLQGALKDDFGEAVLARDMLKLCKFLSLDSFQRRLLWAHKEVSLIVLLIPGVKILNEGRNSQRGSTALDSD